MADDSGYWNWRDEMMKHPEGRAVGGEPCVKCGSPVPAAAHWKHRDRHVCSSDCNLKVNRQFNRLWRKAARVSTTVEWRGGALSAPPEPPANPRTSGPRMFTMSGDTEAPYQWEGYCPLAGDIVERFGVLTFYETYSLFPRVPDGHSLHGALYIAFTLSGHSEVNRANRHGELTRLTWGQFSPTYEPMPLGAPFDVAGVQVRFVREFIRDVTADGQAYTWEAPVAVPIDSAHRATSWSPAYAERSRRLKRISASTARHARRQRLKGVGAERSIPTRCMNETGGSVGCAATRSTPKPVGRMSKAPASTTQSRSRQAEPTHGRTHSWPI